MLYNYNMLKENISEITDRYPFINTEVAGKSLEGRNLYVLQLGQGKDAVFHNGSHHGLEWITSMLLMRFIKDYAKCYVNGMRMKGYCPRNMFDQTTIYVMPMVNPDGVELAQSADKCYECWQANARGVDLNHNYDAGWDTCKSMEAEYGILGPGPTRYGGERPESEPETAALVSFVRKRNIKRLLAFHSQGEEIYWDYNGFEPKESYPLAQELSKASGYRISTPEGIAMGGGCKDWFIKEFRRPGFTIEVGKGKNPLPIDQFDKIYDDILELIILSSIM